MREDSWSARRGSHHVAAKAWWAATRKLATATHYSRGILSAHFARGGETPEDGSRMWQRSRRGAGSSAGCSYSWPLDLLMYWREEYGGVGMFCISNGGSRSVLRSF